MVNSKRPDRVSFLMATSAAKNVSSVRAGFIFFIVLFTTRGTTSVQLVYYFLNEYVCVCPGVDIHTCAHRGNKSYQSQGKFRTCPGAQPLSGHC